jgi:D-erythro-7,8-dihydroneopterin triphosphate epimerase
MTTVRITNLRLRAIIGANDWERHTKQDVIINVTFKYDSAKAQQSDNLKDTVDYKTITKNIIQTVEASQYQLIEKLAKVVLTIVLKNKLVKEATVRIDKPQALRFTDSVSVELSGKK